MYMCVQMDTPLQFGASMRFTRSTQSKQSQYSHIKLTKQIVNAFLGLYMYI